MWQMSGCLLLRSAAHKAALPQAWPRAQHSCHFASARPFRDIPVDKLLYEIPSNPPNPFILPQAEPLVRTLLLFAQLLAVVAAELNSILANIKAPTDAAEATELLRSAIASKLQELTDVSCCAPVLLTDPTTQDQTPALQPPPTPSKRVILLRSAVLISKLATLTFNVKADLIGHADAEMPMSVQALWQTMSTLATHNFDTVTESATCSGSSTPLLVSVRSSQEERTLCVVLCEHLVTTLRQGLKEPQAEAQKLACLQLLSVTLGVMHPELVRREIKRLGKGTPCQVLGLRLPQHNWILPCCPCMCVVWDLPLALLVWLCLSSRGADRPCLV